MKKYDKEIAAYDRAISLQSNYALFWYMRGGAYKNYSLVGDNTIDIHHLQSAIDSYTSAVLLDAENADAFLKEGFVAK
jgi:tetratricopeptide (TPR) repeat protein